MLTNADATLYHRIRSKGNDDVWQRIYLPLVWWYENIVSGVTTNGMKTSNGAANVLTVRVPDVSVDIKKNDYLVRGNSDIEMDTVKSLSGIPHYCITGANYNTFGSNPHIKVVAINAGNT